MKRRSKDKISQKYSQHGLGVEKLPYAIFIPLNMTVEILSRLSVKSLVRFQCVSKLWQSLISDTIKTRSLTNPRLLVAFNHNPWLDSTHIGSSTNPTKTLISAEKQNPILTRELNFNIMYQYVRGLICCLSRSDEFAIYNPTTRQSVVLPGIKHSTWRYSMDGFFGYDPVEDQYKVLCCIKNSIFEKRSCQVFTLGSPQQWRKINSQESFTPRAGATSTVCINGIIYYIDKSFDSVIGTFDVRFERFGHIQIPKSNYWVSILVNYKGKLGCIRDGGMSDSSEMWILEDDIEKQEWSKIELSIPYYPALRSLAFENTGIVVVSCNGEIVVMPKTLDPAETSYAYFHDPKQNETRRVELESTLKGTLKYQIRCCIFGEPDHMENTIALFRSQFNKKPAIRLLPFSMKQLLVIAFFCVALVLLAAML